MSVLISPSPSASGVEQSLPPPALSRRLRRSALAWSETLFEILIAAPAALARVAYARWRMRNVTPRSGQFPPRHILVLPLEHLGDCAATVPLLIECQRQWPQATITVASTTAAGLFELIPGCQVLSVPAAGRRQRLLQQAADHYRFARQHLWPRDFDLCLVPRFDTDYQNATLLGYYSRAPYRISFSERATASRARRNFSYDRLLTHTLIEAPEPLLAASLLALLTPFANNPLPVRPAHLSLDERWVSGELAADSRWIAVCPSAGSQAIKQWGLERWADVMRQLAAIGFGIAIVGGKADEPAAAWLEGEIQGRCRNLAGRTTLPQLLAILARCELFLGNDAGVSHLASLLNLPALGVFGASCPHRFGIWSERGRSIAVTLACSPCHQHPQDRCRVCLFAEPRCFQAIPPAAVYRAAAELLASPHAFSPPNPCQA